MAKLAHRGKRRSKSASSGLLGIAMGLAGLLIVGAFVGAKLWLQKSTELLDQATNCPLSGPKAIHVVVVDRSDPISGLQAQSVKQAIDRMQDEAIPGERFDFFVFEGDTERVLDPLLSVCAPGRPEKANQLYQNPEQIRKIYEERFVRRINSVVEQLVAESERPQSPIMESLRAAAQWSFGSVDPATILIKLTLVSDMIQHSDLNSQYRTRPDFAALESQPIWAQLQPRLKGARVNILYLLRVTAGTKAAKIQNRGHQLFWEQYISAGGGVLTGMERL